MKYFITAALLLANFFCKAQIINIPDINFKKQIIETYDSDHDGELQTSEALAVTNLTIRPVRYKNDDISNFCDSIGVWPSDYTGIEKFTNLERFECHIPELNPYGCHQGPAGTNRNLSFRNNTHLKFVYYGGDTCFSRIDFTGCANLDSLSLSASGDGQETWGITNSFFESIDLSGSPKLRYASFRYFLKLKTVQLQGCDSLKYTEFFTATVDALDLHGLPNFEMLFIQNNMGMTDLPAMNINLANTPKLNWVIANWPRISGINLSGCGALERAYIGASLFFSGETLDFSSSPNLKNLSIDNRGGNLSYLNLKNGSLLDYAAPYAFSLSTVPPLQYICADDSEVNILRPYFESIHQHVNINPYCNFGPAGNFNTMNGAVKINTNGVCDNTNQAVKMLPVKISDGSQYVYSYTNDAGNYKTYTGSGNFNITPYFPYAYFYVNPANAAVSFNAANSTVSTNDFCIQPNGTHNDLEINVLPAWPWWITRPGFNTSYMLVYKNRGTTAANGNVQLNFDNTKMNFVSASENVSVQNTGQLIWNYTGLQPFETRKINIILNVLPPPVNNIGDTVYYMATIDPSVNDETAFDNSFILPQLVRGAFDPNDKQCLEGSKLDISKIGNYLHYQVHFQNEGTDTAFNIVVADTLSNKLDWNSFELVSSSHPCTVNLNGNKAEFIFENIKLPYKSINEPASNGFVAFKIKPKPTVLIGDSLNNKAAIYFDFNLPVITNTATTIVSSASATTPVRLEYFTANAGSNSNMLRWKANCTNISAEFVIEKSSDGIHFRGIENITTSAVHCQLPFNYTDANVLPDKNFYRIKIIDADGKFYYSKVIALGVNKSGIQLQAVSNNSLYYSNTKQQTVQLKIISADGKLIYAANKTVAAGTGQISLPLKNLAKGIYTMTVFATGEIISKRFIQ